MGVLLLRVFFYGHMLQCYIRRIDLVYVPALSKVSNMPKDQTADVYGPYGGESSVAQDMAHCGPFMPVRQRKKSMIRMLLVAYDKCQGSKRRLQLSFILASE